MAKYELLAIFQGTMTEEEVAAQVLKIQELMEKHGAKSIVVEDMGKSRLAYPIQHIRYGYFRMYYFDAEPEVVSLMQEKIILSHTALRAILRKYNAKVETKKLSQIVTDVALMSAAEEAKKEAPRVDAFEAIQTISRERKTPEADTAPVERKTESIELADIDKKLDELLESDLTKV